MNKLEKLAAMANQIAGFFKTQPGDPAANIADHITKFWTLAMRAELIAYVQAGGALDPVARQAVEQLRTTGP